MLKIKAVQVHLRSPERLLRTLAIGMLPVAVVLGSRAAIAQTPPPAPAPSNPTPVSPPPAESTQPSTAEPSSPAVTCTYDPNSGVPNPLGSRASLTIQETEGNTAFIYERFPNEVSSDASDVKAEVDNKRTLTLYETPIADARQLLIDESSYYAVLLGLAVDDPFVDRGFEGVNQTMLCQ